MITILNNTIKIVDGLYSLNDLHKVSGGLKRYQPSNFMRRKDTQAMIAELRTESISSSHSMSLEPVRVVEGIQSDSTPQGTYVCRELVYNYAMWISPRFQLSVIRAFDAMFAHQKSLDDRLNYLCMELDKVSENVSQAGRYLSILGKQVKPNIERNIGEVLKQKQPDLVNFDIADSFLENDLEGCK
ncbi:KilA-N domain-containing protein [Psychrobacter fozii]|uniref:KilA-N domain-containing protein n=1 Tax=Psychrobacter fozii TaxID=198480 RepID=UPI001919E69C|nr:KilA-N domain-containing protein [Psychrobacter fozii]